MAESFKLYKLIILYMLNKVDFPLTNSQISEFILHQGYTTYFKLQQALSELLSSGFIREEATHSRTFYHLTEDGESTIRHFEMSIACNPERHRYIFTEKSNLRIEERSSCKSDYYQLSTGEYSVRCQVFEKGLPLIDLTITAPTEAEAETISNNWAKKNQEVYAMVMAHLL